MEFEKAWKSAPPWQLFSTTAVNALTCFSIIVSSNTASWRITISKEFREGTIAIFKTARGAVRVVTALINWEAESSDRQGFRQLSGSKDSIILPTNLIASTHFFEALGSKNGSVYVNWGRIRSGQATRIFTTSSSGFGCSQGRSRLWRTVFTNWFFLLLEVPKLRSWKIIPYLLEVRSVVRKSWTASTAIWKWIKYIRIGPFLCLASINSLFDLCYVYRP